MMGLRLTQILLLHTVLYMYLGVNVGDAVLVSRKDAHGSGIGLGERPPVPHLAQPVISSGANHLGEGGGGGGGSLIQGILTVSKVRCCPNRGVC